MYQAVNLPSPRNDVIETHAALGPIPGIRDPSSVVIASPTRVSPTTCTLLVLASSSLRSAFIARRTWNAHAYRGMSYGPMPGRAVRSSVILIRLDARTSADYWKHLRPVLMVFTRSGVTLPKVNRFGCNLEHTEYILWGWP